MRSFLIIVFFFSWGAHASIEDLFAKSSCESLIQAQEIETGLKKIYGRMRVLQQRPARAIHPVELTRMIDTLNEVQFELDSGVRMVDQSEMSKANLERINRKFSLTISQLMERLTIFAPQTELRTLLDTVHSNLVGAIYEAAVVNRLQRTNPVVGRNVGYLYPNQIPSPKSRKELDVVIRKAGRDAKDIWVESKFVSAEGMLTDKDYPWIAQSRKILLRQLRNMVELRDSIDPGIELYLIIPSNLNSQLRTDIDHMNIHQIIFPFEAI